VQEPQRSVTAEVLEATGQAGKGLTSAHFTQAVEYREAPRQGSTARVARSRALTIALDGDDVREAIFTGSATFRDDALVASAADARYQPGVGTLRLSGTDAGGPPRVADERIDVVGDAVDLTLQGRRMSATGNVKTTLRPERAAAATAANPAGATVLPGILRDDQVAYVNADALAYLGRSGAAVYTGRASLWQDMTAIRAERIAIDQGNGNLVATGGARSSISLDGEVSTGRASEIRYDDAGRTITYLGVSPSAGAPTKGAASRAGGPPAANDSQAHVTGTQGDLQADRIEVVLAQGGGRAERVEGYGDVTARIDTRIATGSRLTYVSDAGRYSMSGSGTVPVTVVDSCRTTTGRALVFFKSTDRIVVDGNEQARTQTRSTGPCPSPSARR
jgi:lipopolysaccharide export system protein LptA